MSLYARLAIEKLRAMKYKVRGQEIPVREYPTIITTNKIGYDSLGNAWVYDIERDEWYNLGNVDFSIYDKVITSYERIDDPFDGSIVIFKDKVIVDTSTAEEGYVIVR